MVRKNRSAASFAGRIVAEEPPRRAGREGGPRKSLRLRRARMGAPSQLWARALQHDEFGITSSASIATTFLTGRSPCAEAKRLFCLEE